MLLVMGLLAAMSSPVLAKDVSAQQAGVEYAREAMLKVDSEHQDNLKKVAESEKELAEAQKQLAEDKKTADTSKLKLDQAKAKYDKAQAVLDQAWKN
jgi:hypothetical protein